MSLYVGTSGWAYKEWKPGFYPEGLPQSRFLEHYSSVLSACEINATFYRIQSESTFIRWKSGVPERFRFSVKAHRRLTHSKAIAPDGEQRGFLDLFIGSVSVLGPRLGAILFQFPPYRRRDDDGLRRLLDALPAGTPYAFEFRHESWDDDIVHKEIASRSGTVCISETAGEVPETLPPGPIAYVRMRAERYSAEAREGWRRLLQREGATRDAFAFAKHEGIPTGDPFGGVGFAQWLAAGG